MTDSERLARGRAPRHAIATPRHASARVLVAEVLHHPTLRYARPTATDARGLATQLLSKESTDDD